MNPSYGQIFYVVSVFLTLVVRTPYMRRSHDVPVAKSPGSGWDSVVFPLGLLTTIVLPILWMGWGSVLAFADYPLYTASFAAGVGTFAVGLWLLRRSHFDLGRNWSVTLEVRKEHQLVTAGVYRYLRHPMYSAMLLIALSQALVLSNWLAGPGTTLVTLLMIVGRLKKEEAMMRDQFGRQYDDYSTRTKRLIPWIW